MFGVFYSLWAIVLLARLLFMLYAHSAPFQSVLPITRNFGAETRRVHARVARTPVQSPMLSESGVCPWSAV
jgi:hypothetical protein